MTRGLSLEGAQKSRLRSCTALTGVEAIESIPELNDLLSSRGEMVEIPPHLLESAYKLAGLGLRHELSYIEGLCHSGRLEEANIRIGAPFGLSGLIEVMGALTQRSDSGEV